MGSAHSEAHRLGRTPKLMDLTMRLGKKSPTPLANLYSVIPT
jgi:hypothetical protein